MHMSDNLPQEVMDELLDPEFDAMTHGSKGTYTANCRGPLCRRAERKISAERYRELAAREGREVKSYRPRVGAYPEEWLDEIIDWHRGERKKIGKFNSLREYYNLDPEISPVMANAE